MEKLVRYRETLITVLFLGVLFYLSAVPLRDFDIWFHLKSGDLILQKGIVHYDVFSYNTAGREWFPYEWLFQVGIALIQRWFGFEPIKYFIAAVVTVQLAFFIRIFRKILLLPLLPALGITFLFFVSVYEFIDARPHIVAYTFLIINLYYVLNYLIRGKNVLWMTLPITLLWANMHGSVFIDVGIFGGYAGVALLTYFIQKKSEWLYKFRTLSLFTVLTGLLTILPPLGMLQYRLLIIFYRNNSFMSKFIDEWTPLAANPYAFKFYTTTAVSIIVLFAYTLYRKKIITPLTTLLPILIFPFLPYTASRNVYLGYITLGLLLGYVIKGFTISHNTKWMRIGIAIIAIGLILYHITILMDKRYPIKLYYPVNAVMFLKEYHLNGHMFNEYGYGGYLLYQLYPEYKVFYDGRTDLYFQREMPDTLELAVHKYDSDSSFKQYMDKLWNKYDISFVLLRTEKNTVLRKLQRILTTDPGWSLVYWDDYTQIFVRRDGKNTDIIDKFGTVAATPYDQNPIRNNEVDQALAEYTRMASVVDSGHTRNAIGYIELKKGNFDDARKQFELAIPLDPSFESPLMNLAEIAAKDGDLNSALTLYQHAQKLAPDRGLIYVRLGQLMLARGDDRESVRAIWQQGVNETLDLNTTNQLKKLLNTL